MAGLILDTPSRHVYTGDGTTRVFPIPTYIQGDDWIRIEIDGIHVIDRRQWDIVNNSIIFVTAPSIGSTLDILVASSIEAMSQFGSSSAIDVVAENITNINKVATIDTDVTTVANIDTDVSTVANIGTDVSTVASIVSEIPIVSAIATDVTTVANIGTDVSTVANISSDVTTVANNILDVQNAEENAIIAKEEAWRAEAERLTANSYATEPEDVFVKIYTSNNDGTFTVTDTTDYSAYHWERKATTLVTTGVIDDTASYSYRTYSSNKIDSIVNTINNNITTIVNDNITPIENNISAIEGSISDIEGAVSTLDNTTVKLTGTQTIDDIKTFTSSPIVPTPSTDYQVATKKYVDDKTENILENSNRHIVQYRSAHEVRISGGLMSFSGFRFKGQYQKKATKSLFQNGSVRINSNQLPWGMTTRKQESWYGVFACANENDTSITYRCVPFMRIHSPTAVPGLFYLSENTGEGKHTVGNFFSYGYDYSLINGRDVLICSETIDIRPNAMSGRVTKINRVDSVSLGFKDSGGIGALDYVLVAPDFDHYRYCGSFYEDTHEVRNIADSGSLVVSKGIYQRTYPSDGSATAFTECSVAGYISPLASAVILTNGFYFSTSATGQAGTFFSMDGSNHDFVSFVCNKTLQTTESFISQQLFLPFSFQQTYWAQAVGSVPGRGNEKHNIYGWIEE